MTEEDKEPVLGYGVKGAIAVALIVAVVGGAGYCAIKRSKLDLGDVSQLSIRQETQEGIQSEAEQETTGTQDTQDTQEKQKTPVLRSEIIEKFESPEFGFKFEKQNPVEGQENYIGLLGATYIQLIGDEDALIRIDLKIQLKDEGRDEQRNIATSLASFFGEDQEDWVGNEFDTIYDNRTPGYSSSEDFDQNWHQIIALYEEMGPVSYYSNTYNPIGQEERLNRVLNMIERDQRQLIEED